jgi:hypothetical protein
VRFSVGDVREAPLDDGTVFFLYVPFTGPVLAATLDRLRAVAARRPIVVCTLGLDLDQTPWLTRRDLDAFWLAIYDSRIPGAGSRLVKSSSRLPPEADVVAHERP